MEFTPISAIIGGLMIGTASAALLLLNGRIAGISGILGGWLGPDGRQLNWQAMFIAGLLLSGPLVWLSVGRPAIQVDAGAARLLIAGLLVGVGTQLGSGCTSGHGVCGISRFSRRSITATLVFMATAALAVFIDRQVLS